MTNLSGNFIKVGLIGAGIGESRSPRLHENEARACGIACSYRLIDLEQLGVGIEALPQLLEQTRQQGFAGVNITHPCKQAVIPFLDELSAEAAAIGAVNTVVFAGGRRIGHNTDCRGFAESFRRGLPGAAKGNVVLLGAGGAGSAVAHAALSLGVERLVIYDPATERAAALVANLRRHFDSQRVATTTDLANSLAQTDGLIQATPVGMRAHPGLPFLAEWLRAELWVAELVYFPLETELLKRARQLGCRTLTGGGMAVFQAAEAFRLFTDVTPDIERMLRCFNEIEEPV